MNCYPLLDCASSPTETVQIVIHGAADKGDTDGSSPIKIVNPTSMKQDKQARKRPKTQGDLRQDGARDTSRSIINGERKDGHRNRQPSAKKKKTGVASTTPGKKSFESP